VQGELDKETEAQREKLVVADKQSEGDCEEVCDPEADANIERVKSGEVLVDIELLTVTLWHTLAEFDKERLVVTDCERVAVGEFVGDLDSEGDDVTDRLRDNDAETQPVGVEEGQPEGDILALMH